MSKCKSGRKQVNKPDAIPQLYGAKPASKRFEGWSTCGVDVVLSHEFEFKESKRSQTTPRISVNTRVKLCGHLLWNAMKRSRT